jgi:CRP/FNR family cyclic AMP-dependent transcriptional regulator
LMERILFLRRVGLFAGLPSADLRRVAAIAGERHYADGETIVRQDDPADEMHVIVSGQVRVLVGPAQGQPVEVARRGVGDVVGEMAIISHEQRTATLLADGEVRTLVLAQRPFEALLRERPETCLALLRQLCARLRQTTAHQAQPVAVV